ncbi:MAG TPA: RNA polymerase sigma factor [Bryobacteraceae bacterium]|nr:RNA polymerase sigma factor [Bryobacteraceae bacterium]
MTEEEIIVRFITSADEESFSALFRVVAPQILRYFRARGCGPELAEDLLQEVMISVHRHHGELRDARLFRPWLFKIARNAMLQNRRHEMREVPTIEFDEVPADVAGMPVDVLASAQLQQWMTCLTEVERQILMLRYFDGLEYAEIANVLDIPLGTVQWRIFNAKKKLIRLSRGRD